MRLQGHYAIEQLANKLLENDGGSSFLTDGTINSIDEEPFNVFWSKVQKNKKSFDFPPFFVHSYEPSLNLVKCEGFEIRATYPNNIVRLKAGTANCERMNVFIITDIFLHPKNNKQITIRAKQFKDLSPSFTDPFSSFEISNILCKNGLSDSVITTSFSNIVGKYFAFPLIIARDISVDDKTQIWIMQEMDHGCVC